MSFGDQITKCDNCGAQRPLKELLVCLDLIERVLPGEIMPAGECPDCHALAFLAKDDPSNWKLDVTVYVMAEDEDDAFDKIREELDRVVTLDTPVHAVEYHGPAEIVEEENE